MNLMQQERWEQGRTRNRARASTGSYPSEMPKKAFMGWVLPEESFEVSPKEWLLNKFLLCEGKWDSAHCF